MPVKVRMVGFGKQPVRTPAGGTSVLEILRLLGEGAPAVLVENPEATPPEPRWALRPGLAVRLNGRDIRFLQGLATPVEDGDELVVMVPLVGG